MQSERMREEPEEKMGEKILTNLQAECIPSSEQKLPLVSHTGWEEVNGIEVPPSFFSENHPLGLALVSLHFLVEIQALGSESSVPW